MYFIILLKYIIINILINLILVNFIFNFILYNFIIRLKDFYLNRYFTQFLNTNRDNLVIVILFSI
jgi:hypothetical protein